MSNQTKIGKVTVKLPQIGAETRKKVGAVVIDVAQWRTGTWRVSIKSGPFGPSGYATGIDIDFAVRKAIAEFRRAVARDARAAEREPARLHAAAKKAQADLPKIRKRLAAALAVFK